jgi:putative transposase
MIRVDNSPEFISSKLSLWCEENSIQLLFIEPGSPNKNAYIERFNGTFRKEVDQITKKWMYDNNNNRPHTALKNKTPVEFRIKV